MSNVEDLYITLQKFFWTSESDLHNQIHAADLRLMCKEPEAERLLKSYELRVRLDMLNKLQRDINKLLEVYLYEE